MTVSASTHVTVGVSDLDEALTLFETHMGLTVESRQLASASLKSAWGLDTATRVELVELSANGYPFGRLRLASYRPQARAKVRVHSGPEPHDGAADIGCKAIDFYVRAPIDDAFQMVQSLGYPVRSAPVLHEVGETVSEEFVFWGPDGVPLLFMVGHRHAADQLRPGSPEGRVSEIATVSVVGESIDRTRAYYEGLLGLDLIVDDKTSEAFLDKASELTGIPSGTGIHWLLYGGANEPSGKILVLHFSGTAQKRLAGRMRPGRLGFSMLTHRTDSIDRLASRMASENFEILSPPQEVVLQDRQERIMLALGPNEELFEFVEKSI